MGAWFALSDSVQAQTLANLATLDPARFYSWSPEPRSGFGSIPEGSAYIPMSWGRYAPAANQQPGIDGAAAGQYDTLLGFNVPDLASQANMTVSDALALWPTLEATGLRLGSPAPAGLNNGWLTDFMDGAEAQNLRVDFLAGHRYGGTNPQTFFDFVDGLYAQYNLPIWITEFAVRDGNAATPADNRYTDDEVYDFMAAVLPGLEQRSYVERYAWFPSGRTNPFVASSSLFEEDGERTRVGRLYQGESTSSTQASNHRPPKTSRALRTTCRCGRPSTSPN